MGISVETLQDFSFASKKHRDNYLVFGGLSLFDPKSELFQSRPESGHNDVAMLVHCRTRIDRLGHPFEKCDYEKAKVRRRRRLREIYPIDHCDSLIELAKRRLVSASVTHRGCIVTVLGRAVLSVVG